MLSFWETILAYAIGSTLGIAVAQFVLVPAYGEFREWVRRHRARKQYPARMAELALMHTETLNNIERGFEEELRREGLTDEEREHITTHRNMAKQGATMSYHLACDATRQDAGIEG